MLKINSSPKKYNHYKSDTPDNTITRISTGFEPLGLTLSYQEQAIAKDFSWSSRVIIPELHIEANGKGTTRELAKASAFAELAERFSSGFFFNFSELFDLYEKSDIINQEVFGDLKMLEAFSQGTFLPTGRRKFGDTTVGFSDFVYPQPFPLKMQEQLASHPTFSMLTSATSLGENCEVNIPYNFI